MTLKISDGEGSLAPTMKRAVLVSERVLQGYARLETRPQSNPSIVEEIASTEAELIQLCYPHRRWDMLTAIRIGALLWAVRLSQKDIRDFIARDVRTPDASYTQSFSNGAPMEAFFRAVTCVVYEQFAAALDKVHAAIGDALIEFPEGDLPPKIKAFVAEHREALTEAREATM